MIRRFSLEKPPPRRSWIWVLVLLTWGLVQWDAQGGERKVPASIIYPGEKGRIIIVEKSTQRLLVYDHNYNLIETFRVTTGKKRGDKQREGDLKTPEGVYFFIDIIDGSNLPSRYGVMAIVTDYPNPFDRLKKKTGSGIWLHATDEPERIKRAFDSRGCVVVTNNDIVRLSQWIELMETPMIIVEKVDYIREKGLSSLREEVFGFLERWRSAMEEGKKGVFLSLYEGKGGLPMYRSGYTLDIRNIRILRHGRKEVVVYFNEVSRGGKGTEEALRHLYLVRREGGFRIVRERAVKKSQKYDKTSGM